MVTETKGFDGAAFYRALERVVSAREMTWKQVAEETGVGASTLARMGKGSKPDAASLAALSAWAGLNPSDFVEGSFVPRKKESIGEISKLLRGDPNLDPQGVEMLEAIVRAAYERLKKSKSGDNKREK